MFCSKECTVAEVSIHWHLGLRHRSDNRYYLLVQFHTDSNFSSAFQSPRINIVPSTNKWMQEPFHNDSISLTERYRLHDIIGWNKRYFLACWQRRWQLHHKCVFFKFFIYLSICYSKYICRYTQTENINIFIKLFWMFFFFWMKDVACSVLESSNRYKLQERSSW